MLTDEIRRSYLDFFKSKDHLVVDSAPLIPQNDPSLLWINAGMTPFKPYFNGSKEPPRTRMASSQKCIRTNDIENVGKTARHHTFFEMLGNFSFGDYFKEEAIAWAWEYVTNELNLPEERLIITIFKDDDEAFDIWHKQVGLPESKIVRMGKKENFWQIGTGPCGPCSEIHIDRGSEFGTGPEDVLGGEGDRYLELWNLVFTQYDYTEEGEYVELPQKNIDTGMGLERTASVLQGTKSNYEIDIIYPLIKEVEEKTRQKYRVNSGDINPHRVIADHIRGVTMAIFDGAFPSNEGRGYVIRRLIRRAVRYGQKLGLKGPFMYGLVENVNNLMAGGYPELPQRQEHVEHVIKSEEERFLQTLDQGMEIVEEIKREMKAAGSQKLSGEKAFKLYDTYGFPLDLTEDIMEEAGFEVDKAGFKEEMEKQRTRARQAREDISFAGDSQGLYETVANKLAQNEEDTSDFIGYHNLKTSAKIQAIVHQGEQVESLQAGQQGQVIFDVTPFYAESGGQIGDKGVIQAENGNMKAEVIDVKEQDGLILHQVKQKTGELQVGTRVNLKVNSDLRNSTARNHTATHLLHQALMNQLGDHVNQSGSLVTPDRLRFDFTHFEGLSFQELRSIEREINRKIIENMDVTTTETSLEEAKKMGAQALFSEKYGHQVRVVKSGDYSIELCGGTHVQATGEIGLFKILQESSIAAGIRRIEAVTGLAALDYVEDQEDIISEAAEQLKTRPEELLSKIEGLQAANKDLKRQLKSLQDKLADSKAEDLTDKIETINGIKTVITEVENIDQDGLRTLSDELISEIGSGLVLLAQRDENKVVFVAKISPDLVKQGLHAGKLVGEVARITGGGGGGRPDMAQAGGSQPEKLPEALERAREIIAAK
ncbi:MAG: alanine--tRNA ligase [Bacillota bacterium]